MYACSIRVKIRVWVFGSIRVGIPKPIQGLGSKPKNNWVWVRVLGNLDS